MHLYVYYKVPSGQAEDLRAAVAGMQARLGVPCSLQRRPEAKDGLHTWMEAYPGVDAAFGARLEAAVAEAGLARWISGTRHAEWFEELSACA